MRRLSPLLLVACLLGSAAPASAKVTASRITSPADPTFGTYDADLGPNAPGNRIKVDGVATSTAPAGDRVDVRCFWTDSGGTLRANVLALRVPLAPDGSFTVGADPASLSDNPFAGPTPSDPSGTRDDAPGVQTCRLRATPAVGAITELNGAALPDFSGPRINVARFGSRTLGVRGGGLVTVDFGVGTGGLRGQAEWSSRCGTFSFRPLVNAAALSPAQFPNWDCVRALLPPDPGDAGAQVRVDGAPAYTGSSAPSFDFDADGVLERPAAATGVTVDYRRGLTTGTVTTVERSALQRCSTPAFPPTAANCPTLVATGVELERRTVLADDGLEATITETLLSVDGAAHAVGLDAEQYVVFDNDPVFRFPGEDLFAPHGSGDQPPLGPAGLPGSVFTRDAVTPDTPRQGSGVETWDRPPADVRFVADDFRYLERSTQEVPAGGSATAVRVFRAARTLAEAEAGAAAAVQRLTPPPPPAVAPPVVIAPPPAAEPAPRCTLPRVKRNALYGTVRSRIKRAGCRVGAVRSVRSRVRKGRVVRIRPASTTKRRTVALGTRVTIERASGKPPKPRKRAKRPAKTRVAGAAGVHRAGASSRPSRPLRNARSWTPAR